MKNILLKSAQVFVFMSLMNFLLSVLMLNIMDLSGGSFGMYPFLVLIECLVVSLVAFITVLIFKKIYNSIFKMAILFQVVYIISLILTGFNPFRADSDSNFFGLLLYVNSIIVLIIIFLYSKIISSKNKNLS